MKNLLLILGISFVLAACKPSRQQPNTIAVTTNILGDAVQNLRQGIDSIEVKVLMGPGVDPHLYKASQGDVEALSQAHLIVYNGLHLEGKMTGIFEKLRNRHIFAAGEHVDTARLINASEYAGNYDPHIWFDPLLWSQAIKALSGEMQKQFPRWQKQIALNAEEYLKEINRMHQRNRQKLKAIPDSQRVLITAHDAFKYFGRVYDVEVKGLQGISTTAEYGIQDVSSLVNFIVKHRIKAVFVESSVPKRSIEAVIQGAAKSGHRVKLGGELYSDALGGPGSGAETYLSMFEENVKTIARALQ